MMKKKLISIAVAVAMLFSLAAPAMAEPFEYIDFVRVNGLTIGILGDDIHYGQAMVDGLSDKSLKTVSIPDTVITTLGIGDERIRAVNFIAMYAFKGTDIEEVYLPKTIQDIRLFAFQDCTKLRFVDFGMDYCPGGLCISGAFDNIAPGAPHTPRLCTLKQ